MLTQSPMLKHVFPWTISSIDYVSKLEKKNHVLLLIAISAAVLKPSELVFLGSFVALLRAADTDRPFHAPWTAEDLDKDITYLICDFQRDGPPRAPCNPPKRPPPMVQCGYVKNASTIPITSVAEPRAFGRTTAESDDQEAEIVPLNKINQPLAKPFKSRIKARARAYCSVREGPWRVPIVEVVDEQRRFVVYESRGLHSTRL